MMRRSNEEWLSSLRSDGAARDSALADLREIILAGLPYALSKSIDQNDPRFPAFLEEVAQETILRATARLDTFQGRSQFTTWVHTIAVHIAFTELRKAKTREISLDQLQDGFDGEDQPHELPDGKPEVENSVERSEMVSTVLRVIQSELTEKQRTALLAVVIQDLPLDEVARSMGIEVNALYKLLHDARVKLKKRLETLGLAPSEIMAAFDK